ncbi:MAG: hypothetical protein DVB28_000850 [Verrucomicrobia bacterium]|nr:MAG: hypothetical protein DVB28_000850 [Verrucomicrobiota bacterium]
MTEREIHFFHPLGLPSHLRAVPIQPVSSLLGLEVCLALRVTPDPLAGFLLTLRETTLASVVLGCVTDAEGKVLDWLELWLQKTGASALCSPTFGTPPLNHLLDLEWARLAANLKHSAPDCYIHTSFVNAHLQPVVISLATNTTSLSENTAGQPWKLCTDDTLLAAAGLPSYHASHERFLSCSLETGETEFRKINPSSNPFQSAETASSSSAVKISLFSSSPRLIVRRLIPVSLEQHLALLGGIPWPGIENAKQPLVLSGIYEDLSRVDYLQQGAAFLISARAGRAGCLLETLHLKLVLLRQIVSCVQSSTRFLQLPFFNLCAASFGVRFENGADGLPPFWNAKVYLLQPSDAVSLTVPGTLSTVYQRRGAASLSIYQPEALNKAVQGHCSIRILRILPSENGDVCLEVSLSSSENLAAVADVLVCLQVPLSSELVDLHGFFDPRSKSIKSGEAILKTLPRSFSNASLSALQSAVGSTFSHLPFSMIPSLSSPVDLYSLGVLATQILVANTQIPLPFALDALLSLTRTVFDRAPAASLGTIIEKTFSEEPHRLDKLGPQHLLFTPLSSEEALAAIPPQLWWDTLALICRFFPGLGSESFSRHFGAGQEGGLEAVYDAPLRLLDSLILRTRAALFSDWRSNLEIGGLINSVSASL